MGVRVGLSEGVELHIVDSLLGLYQVTISAKHMFLRLLGNLYCPRTC